MAEGAPEHQAGEQGAEQAKDQNLRRELADPRPKQQVLEVTRAVGIVRVEVPCRRLLRIRLLGRDAAVLGRVPDLEIARGNEVEKRLVVVEVVRQARRDQPGGDEKEQWQ